MCVYDEAITEEDLFIMTGICQGFHILDSNCSLQYNASNYGSVELAKEELTSSVRQELSEGKISKVEQKPLCVHSLGAIRRPDGRVRCITDCSRPDISINNHMNNTARKFAFSSVDDAVSISNVDGLGAVVDISAAYRSINIHPSNRTYCGFKWNTGEGDCYYEENVMCFGIRSACSIFNSVTDFVRRYCYRLGISVINYLDDFYVPGNNFEKCQEMLGISRSPQVTPYPLLTPIF